MMVSYHCGFDRLSRWITVAPSHSPDVIHSFISLNIFSLSESFLGVFFKDDCLLCCFIKPSMYGLVMCTRV